MCLILFLGGCSDYKYGIARDTWGHWGKDAQYQIIKVGNYELKNLETNVTIDRYIHKYFQDGDIVYFNGSMGNTILNSKTGEIKQNIYIESFSNKEKETYNDKEFTTLTADEYVEIRIGDFTSFKNYRFSDMKIYLAYDPNDEITKEYLLASDHQNSIKIIINNWFENHFDSYKFNNIDDQKFLDYLNNNIPEIKINKVDAWY